MSRIAKAAVLTIAAAAAMVGTAGGASAHDHGHGHHHRHHGAAAQGAAIGSPGVLSGNLVQVPIDVPINLCGNTIDIIGLLNPASGNTCVNA